MFILVKTLGVRASAFVAVLALVVQPCVACLTGGSNGTAIAAQEHASHGKCALPADYGNHAAPQATGCPTLVETGSPAADACPSLSARSSETYVPTPAVPALPAPAALPAVAPAPPTIEHALPAPRDPARDPVPLFLRHAAFRI